MNRTFSSVVIVSMALLALIGGTFGITNALAHRSPSSHSSPSTHKSPTTSTNDPGSSATERQIAQAIFKATNQDRVTFGLAPLQWNNALYNSAHKHNLRMAAANIITNQLPGEPDFGVRIKQAGVKAWWVGENFGMINNPTQAGALSLNSMILKAQGSNPLLKLGDSVGIDIIVDSKHHRLWLTEDLANIKGKPPIVLPGPNGGMPAITPNLRGATTNNTAFVTRKVILPNIGGFVSQLAS